MNTTLLILDPGKRAYIPKEMEHMVQVVDFDKVNIILSNKSLQTLVMRAGYVLKNKPGINQHTLSQGQVHSRCAPKKTPPRDHYGAIVSGTTPFRITKRPR